MARWPRTLSLVLLVCLFPAVARAERGINGDATIRGPVGNSEIVITTTDRLAGAIHSLTWQGKEFIDSFDHGRQLQSASNLDLGQPFHGETFNPTEAGSRADGAGPTSTSVLLHKVVGQNSLQTTTQMAFWLRPGELSGGNPAVNRTVLSNHLLTKRVTIGWRDMPHVIQYNVTFSLPVGEFHRYAQFETVTGYMPEEFSEFFGVDLENERLVPLTDGPGEQSLPVLLSTQDGAYAMGVYSPDQPAPGFERAGYGRFRFPAARVTKWNSVYRIRNPADGVPPGEYSFRNFVIVGSRETVANGIVALHTYWRDEEEK